MKRILLATAAISVLTASFAGSGRAQSLDLKKLCNPALGIKCGSTGTVNRTSTINTRPKVTIQTPQATIRVPQVRVQKPQVVPPEPTSKHPRFQVVVPKNVTPDAKVPGVRIVTPDGKPQTVAVPGTSRTPTVRVPGVTGRTPPKVRQPGIKVAPDGKVVIKPGSVDIEELRKKLASDLAAGRIKVAPGGSVRIPEVTLDRGASQVQADVVALRDLAKVAAAATGRGPDVIDVIDRTLTEKDVRRSSEDFDEALGRIGVTPGAVDFRNVDLGKVLQRGDRVVTNSGDRMVVENNGVMRVLRDDDVLLAQPGTKVKSFQYKDGSTRSLMAYEDGSRVETVRAPDGRVLRRSSIAPDGTELVLFDDTEPSEQVLVNQLPEVQGPGVLAYRNDGDMTEALGGNANVEAGRLFSLAQIRDIDAVRKMAPGINIDTIHFASNSAAIRPEEAEDLAALGYAMLEAIARDPREIFLIEGHTDARGFDAYNLALSDRRAESVALALIEYFGVPPENLVLQGYGESDLLVATEEAEQANRRAAVRRITPLLTEL